MLTIDRLCYDDMIGHLQAVYPQEGCGLLAGSHGRAHRHYPITNVHHSTTHYLMDAQEQIEAMLEIEREGLSLLAIYHSHPHTDPYPSETDVTAAAYPDAAYIIVSFQNEKPAVASFFIRHGQIIPTTLSLS